MSLSTFEQCWKTGEAWSLAGQCPHWHRDALDDPEPVLESLPSMFAWQTEALVAWHEAGSRGLIEAVTGAGKSMIALHAIHEIVLSGGRALVVVPTIELQAQWLVLLQSAFARRFIVEKLLDRVARIYTEPHIVVAVINSARDGSFSVTGNGNLLVVDEVHRCASPVNARVLDDRFDYRLGLSATVARPDAGHHRYLEPYFGPIVYRYLYAEAVHDNVVARFRLTLRAVTMYRDEWDGYLELGRLVRMLHRAFLSKYDLPIPDGEFVAVLIKACAGHFSTRSPELQEVAIKLRQALFQRRTFLDGLRSKLDELARLVPLIHRAKRCLIFGQTIASAEASAAALLQQGVRAASIHSGTPRSLRREQLYRFERGDLEVLAAPRILHEGIDVPEVGLAVIATASSSERQLIQRLGRILRRKPDGSAAQLVVLFASGTVEDPTFGAQADLLPQLIASAKSFEILGQPSTPMS